jgi:HEAT repeat protein
VTDKPKRADTEAYWASAVIGEGTRDAGNRRASDHRTTAEIIAAYMECQRNDDATASLSTVHFRGGETEFRAGIQLLDSHNPLERVVGADVLAQLGWRDRAFLDESVAALLSALSDQDVSVVQSAIFALGHRASPRSIPALLPFVDHASTDLRYAVVHGLMPHDTPAVVDALAKLSRDTDPDVRNWATFALGSQLESDSPSLRKALRDRLADSDPEVRGEALVGLARRHDASVATEVMRELEGESYSGWAIEAAGLLGDAIFLSALRTLGRRLSGENAVLFRGGLEEAIAACEHRLLDDSPTLQ